MITLERLREVFAYEALTGNFIRRLNYANARAGIVAGWVTTNGYIRVRVDMKVYAAHRLVWLWHHGEFPAPGLFIDHINGTRADNRIENLRLATLAENAINSKVRRDSTSGLKGVYYGWPGAKNPWVAYIHERGKRFYLGRFPTAEAANAAYFSAAQKRFGKFARAS